MPAAWVAAATARQTSNGSNPTSDWDQGYGYQFWRCRHGAYRGDGAFGQYCIVLPEQDAVIAITSGVQDMQAVLNLVWDQLLPAMKAAPLPGRRRRPGPSREEARGLSLPPQPGGRRRPSPAGLGPDLRSRPTTTASRPLGLDSGQRDDARAPQRRPEHRVPAARASGARGGTLPWDGELEQAVAATGAWTADDTYTVKACSTRRRSARTLGLWFEGDALVLDVELNVGFGPTKRPPLVGLPWRAAASGRRTGRGCCAGWRSHNSRPDPFDAADPAEVADEEHYEGLGGAVGDGAAEEDRRRGRGVGETAHGLLDHPAGGGAEEAAEAETVPIARAGKTSAGRMIAPHAAWPKKTRLRQARAMAGLPARVRTRRAGAFATTTASMKPLRARSRDTPRATSARGTAPEATMPRA